MSQIYIYPNPSASANPSVGTNGVTAPTSSTEVSGINPSGNLQPLQTDSSGNLLVSLNADVPTLPTNVAQFGGSNVVTGTGVSGAGIPRVTVSSDSSVSVSSSALPTGAATSALQTSGNSTLTSIQANQTNGTQVTTISGTVPLPTGAATSALQTSGNSTLTTISGQLPATLGAHVTAASTAVNIASDQVVPVSATALPLPTGAATSALQTSGNTSLTSIAAGTPTSLGQKTMANSSSVAIASDQTAIPISGTVTITPSGEQNVNLNQVGGSSYALGAAVTTASIPVNIASDQVVPIVSQDTTASGSITTQNLVPGGTATAGSAVAIALNGKGTVTIQVTGTYTGALSPQVTTDGVNWITQGGAVLQNMATGASSATIPSASVGIWQIEINGHAQFRITALAAVTGTATITLRAAAGTSQVSVMGVATAANQTNVQSAPGTSQTVALTIQGNASSIAVPVSAASLPLPSNAAIETGGNLATIVSRTPALGQTTMASSSPVVIASNQSSIPVTQGGKAPVAQLFLNMGSTNVTTSAYVQLTASIGATPATMVEVFMASGEVVLFSVGASGSEVVQFNITPGGNGQVPLAVAASSRIAVKSLTNNITSGYLVVNLYA